MKIGDYTFTPSSTFISAVRPTTHSILIHASGFFHITANTGLACPVPALEPHPILSNLLNLPGSSAHLTVRPLPHPPLPISLISVTLYLSLLAPTCSRNSPTLSEAGNCQHSKSKPPTVLPSASMARSRFRCLSDEPWRRRRLTVQKPLGPRNSTPGVPIGL